jgi:tetratricopeptide (TPR) repeat protein
MVPTSAPSTKTFISYAHDDLAFALKLAGDLRKAGANIWLDRFDIPVGKNWPRAVQEALDSCSQFLVILSPASVESDNVLAELDLALEDRKLVFPVLRGECRRPFRIRSLQYADFTKNYERGLSDLLNALGVKLEQATPTPSIAVLDKLIEEDQDRAVQAVREAEAKREAKQEQRAREAEEERKAEEERAREEEARRKVEEDRRARKAAEAQRLPQHVNLFLSYAHEDEILCKRLLKHLSQLQRSGVDGWYDRRITAGSEWAGQIDEHLNSAEIILLLVSADFLASDYCYDVEMKRALERHDHGEARLIPVILRPCDWQSSPFARLQASPKNGKPVVDWKTADHGFLNVVEGLRRVVEEIGWKAQPAPAGAAPSLAFQALPALRPWRWIAAAALVVLLGTAALSWSVSRKYLAEGDAYLNVGQYAQARQSYQQARKWNPLSRRASLGLEIIKLADFRSDAVAFQQKLDELRKSAPGDARLKALQGDFGLSQNHLDEAEKLYRWAITFDPNFADGYFRLGMVADMRGEAGHAIAMFRQAVELSPGSRQYRDGLADAYFRHGEYEKASEEYERIDRFPSAALEQANILRLLGRLDRALEKQQLALTWLADASIMTNPPENSLPWILEVSQNQRVSIPSIGQKRCYAHWELSATFYLKGDETQARDHAAKAAQACGPQQLDVKSAMAGELDRLADEREELASRARSFQASFLK